MKDKQIKKRNRVSGDCFKQIRYVILVSRSTWLQYFLFRTFVSCDMRFATRCFNVSMSDSVNVHVLPSKCRNCIDLQLARYV